MADKRIDPEIVPFLDALADLLAAALLNEMETPDEATDVSSRPKKGESPWKTRMRRIGSA